MPLLTTTPTPTSDEPVRLGTPNPHAPLTRPYYATLTDLEKRVLQERQSDSDRATVMEYDPFT